MKRAISVRIVNYKLIKIKLNSIKVDFRQNTLPLTILKEILYYIWLPQLLKSDPLSS